MTSRERVRRALEHEKVDRLPIDIGGLVNLTSLHKDAYRKLLDALGYDEDIEIGMMMHQAAAVSGQVRRRFHGDTAPLYFPVDEAAAGVFVQPDGSKIYTDSWGVRWKMPAGGLYYDMVESPLSLDKLDADAFQTPRIQAEKFAAVRRQAERAREEELFTIFSPPAPGVLLQVIRLLGYEDALMCMLSEPEEFETLAGKIADYQISVFSAAIDALGDLVDAFLISDDLVSQSGYLFNPGLYRKLIKPYHKKMVNAIKARGDYKVIYHCCGAVSGLIEDFIDCGFDALNPIQVAAAGMEDTKRLKMLYGDRITFWGGSCDNQHVLPESTPDALRAEVRRRIGDLAGSSPGGVVLCSVHNIQKDVPVENVLALYDTLFACAVQ